MDFRRINYLPFCIVFVGACTALFIFFGSDLVYRTSAMEIGRGDDSHLYGSTKASIKIVEFSDYECPYCSRLHETLTRIVDESGGEVSWEYRHFPLSGHPHAMSAAYAGECVARLSGNEAFWKYSKVLFDNQRSLGETLYAAEAGKLGVDQGKFAECIGSNDTRQRIIDDQTKGASVGAHATPYSVIVFSDGTQKPVEGALPYEQWMALINK